MHKAVPLTLFALSTFITSGCTPGAKAADPAQIEQAIRAKEADWVKAYKAKDVDALASQYSEDAALGGPGEALATSSADRRKALEALTSDANFALDFAADRVLVAQSGDLASSRGHYSITTTDAKTNKPVTSSGTYLTVYKKDKDGSWKAVEDFITPGPAEMSTATAAK